VGFAAAAWLRVRSYDEPAGKKTATAAGNATAEVPEIVTETDTPVESSTIVETTDTAAAARAREQRYQELLRSAPPGTPPQSAEGTVPAAPVQKVTPPTLLDRVVKPIASALGINRPAPQPQAMATQKPPPQPPATETTGEPKNESDAESDVTPPRVVAVEFLPALVQDGEQTTFAAIVTDDKSGARGLSGVIASPSGAQQGFASQKEGDTGRFSARITIPKDAAEGIWSVKYLTVSDNAGNSINLNMGQGLPPNASFRVTSASSDSKGPTLRAVRLDTPSMSAGDKNQVWVEAEDDKSGVSLVSGVFVSPTKQARIGFGCRLANNIWQCPVNPPSCVDCGAWQLEQIQLQDKANNMTTVRADNPIVANVHLELFGKDCDKEPPVLTSLTVDPAVVSNTTGGVIRVTATATDEPCGVASLSGVAWPPPASKSTTRLYFPFRPTTGDTFVGEIQVPASVASGTWTIGWVQALDKGHNQKAYSPSDPVIARVTFTVE